MIRKVKAAGLTFVVAAAALSMMAASAQATQFHVNTPNRALLTGEQLGKHNFQITSSWQGPSVQCNIAHFEATPESSGPQVTAQELTMTPQYTGCTFLGLSATVTVNGCKYTFTQEVPTVSKRMLLDISGCTAANPRIEAHIPGCTVTIPQQTGLGYTFFSQNGTHVNVHATVAGLTYETHGAACAHQPETVLKNDAVYFGTVTLKGFVDSNTQAASHNGHSYTKGVAGSQVSLTVT